MSKAWFAGTFVGIIGGTIMGGSLGLKHDKGSYLPVFTFFGLCVGAGLGGIIGGGVATALKSSKYRIRFERKDINKKD
jgi:hypothetical protein